MKKLFVLFLLLPIIARAQPSPPVVEAGTIGNTAVYTGTHRLGPGIGTNIVANPNQFSTAGGVLSLKSGALGTNIVGSFVGDGSSLTNMDTNIFSASGFLHILQLITNGAAYQAQIATNTISANQITNTINGQAGTNIFSAQAMTYLASLGGGGGSVLAGSNITVSGSTVGLNNALTNVQSIGFNGGSTIQGGGNTNSFTRIFTGNSSTNGFMPVVNAMDFGLSTTGDQTANIQLAINNATNLGQVVFIPAGNYTISNGPIKLSRGIVLMGETPAASSTGTILNSGLSSSNILFIPTGSKGTIVRGITFAANDQTNGAIAVTTSTNANPTGTSQFKIENCSFINFNRGVYLNYSWDIQLINNFYVNCFACVQGSNNVNAVDVWGGHFNGVYGVKIDGFAVFNWNIHSIFEVCSNAVAIANDSEQINIDNSYFESNTNSVVANATYDLNFNFNEVDNSSGTNVVVVAAKTASISGNHFSSSTSPSFDVDATSYKVTVCPPNSFIGSPSYKFNPITGLICDGTNVIIFGAGGYYGLVLSGAETNAAGSRVAYLSDTGASLTTNGYLANTNFISGQLYTNTFGGPIYVSVNVNTHVSNVSGQAAVALWVFGSTTNAIGFTSSTLGFASDQTNILSGWIPTGLGYVFTNLLSGAGDTATLFGGQIAMPSGTNLTGVQSIVGTANQVTASTVSGVTTLSTPNTFVAPGSVTATTVYNGTGSGITNANVNTLITNVGPYSVVGQTSSSAGNAQIVPVSQIATFASATNSLQLAPFLFGTNWLLVSSTPCNITNAINGTAGYTFGADLEISNSTAATFTCRVDTAWIPRGWLATNIATGTLGFNGVTVAAAKEAFIHVETRGINETNYWISY